MVMEIREASRVLEQAMGTSDAILQQLGRLEARAREVLSTAEILAVHRVVLTGCGDSYFAAVSAKWSFERLVGAPVEAVPSMTAGRYTLPTLAGQGAGGLLVVAISSSGEVARTVEAVRAARGVGARTLALTARPDSRVGRAAESVVLME